MGLVASMTVFPAILAVPARRNTSAAAVPFDRKDNQFGKFGCFGKIGDARFGVFCYPVCEFVGCARAQRHLMTMLEKAAGQRLCYIS